MQKLLIANYPGRCALTGLPIKPGDLIVHDQKTRRTILREHMPRDEDGFYVFPKTGQSNYTRTSTGAELYRNKAGRCIDAPCCGCCNY